MKLFQLNMLLVYPVNFCFAFIKFIKLIAGINIQDIEVFK
jgi:hypothetical protein